MGSLFFLLGVATMYAAIVSPMPYMVPIICVGGLMAVLIDMVNRR